MWVTGQLGLQYGAMQAAWSRATMYCTRARQQAAPQGVLPAGTSAGCSAGCPAGCWHVSRLCSGCRLVCANGGGAHTSNITCVLWLLLLLQACQPVPCEQLEAAGPPKREHGGDTCQVRSNRTKQHQWKHAPVKLVLVLVWFFSLMCTVEQAVVLQRTVFSNAEHEDPALACKHMRQQFWHVDFKVVLTKFASHFNKFTLIFIVAEVTDDYVGCQHTLWTVSIICWLQIICYWCHAVGTLLQWGVVMACAMVLLQVVAAVVDVPYCSGWWWMQRAMQLPLSRRHNRQ